MSAELIKEPETVETQLATIQKIADECETGFELRCTLRHRLEKMKLLPELLGNKERVRKIFNMMRSERLFMHCHADGRAAQCHEDLDYLRGVVQDACAESCPEAEHGIRDILTEIRAEMASTSVFLAPSPGTSQ